MAPTATKIGVTAMQTSTKGAVGFGALAWLAGQVGEGRAFMAAAEQMNAQIEADVDALSRSLRLPDSPPLLPLTGSRARSKVGILMRCWLAGAGLTWALVALPFILAIAMAHDPKTPLALGVVGGLGIGLGAAIFVGWLPALIFFMITGSRENNRRSRGVVLDRFSQYWQARQQAQVDLERGADANQVGAFLWSFRIATESDGVLWGASA